MPTYQKCECGALFEATTCLVCQEERWAEEIQCITSERDRYRARIADLEGAAKAERTAQRERLIKKMLDPQNPFDWCLDESAVREYLDKD